MEKIIIITFSNTNRTSGWKLYKFKIVGVRMGFITLWTCVDYYCGRNSILKIIAL